MTQKSKAWHIAQAEIILFKALPTYRVEIIAVGKESIWARSFLLAPTKAAARVVARPRVAEFKKTYGVNKVRLEVSKVG